MAAVSNNGITIEPANVGFEPHERRQIQLIESCCKPPFPLRIDFERNLPHPIPAAERVVECVRNDLPLYEAVRLQKKKKVCYSWPKTKAAADAKIQEYKLSGQKTVFWMTVASRVCLFAMFALFGTSALMPVIAESPSWLPWTALGVSLVFGFYVRAKLDAAVEQRKREYEAVRHYSQLLEQPHTTSTMQPQSKCDLALDKRFKSEYKFGRKPASEKWTDFLASESRWCGVADNEGKVGSLLSYYNIDVDPRIAKAYVAAEHHGLPLADHRKWLSLRGDVELCRNDLMRGRGAKYNAEMAKIRAEVYAMPSPFSTWSGRHIASDDPKSLELMKGGLGKYARAETAQEFEVLANLQKEFATLWKVAQKQVEVVNAPTFALLEQHLTHEENSISDLQEAVDIHHEKLLPQVTKVLLCVAQQKGINITAADLDSERQLSEDAKFNALVKGYRDFKKAILAAATAFNEAYATLCKNFMRFYEGEIASKVAHVEEKPKAPKLPLCVRCSNAWTQIKAAIWFSPPVTKFVHEKDQTKASARVIKINEEMKKIDKSILNHYYTKEVLIGWLALVVLAFVEYAYFSNPWVIFGVNAAFLARMPLMMWMEARMKKLEEQKDHQRVLEGVYRGPELLLPPSHYPFWRNKKEISDRIGIDGVPMNSGNNCAFPQALVNYPSQ